MAPINPDYKEVPLRDYRESRPISQPQADTSKGTTLKALGDTFASAVNLADVGVKTYLGEDIREQTEAIRESRTASLGTVSDIVSGRIQPLAETTDVALDPVSGKPVPETYKGPLSLLSTDTPPEGMASLGRTVGILGSARENGKLSQTDYYGKLDQLAKSYRARFPGYKDYIDAQIAHHTGVNPANAYMTSLLADINSYMTSGKESRNKTEDLLNFALKKGYQGTAGIIDQWERGEISDSQARSHVARFTTQEWMDERDKAARDKFMGNTQVDQVVVRQHASRMLGSAADNYFYGIEAETGKSFKDLYDESRRGNISSERAVQLGEAFTRLQQKYVTEMNLKLAKDGITDRLGGPKDAKELVQSYADAIFGTTIAALRDKDFGAVDSAKNALDAMTNDFTTKMFKEKDLREFMLLQRSVKGIAPEYGVRFFEWGLNALPNLDNSIKTFIKKEAMTAIVQPAAANGGVNTFQDSIAALEAVNIRKPQTFDALMKLIDDKEIGLTSPSTPVHVKKAIANYFFDPKNLQVINDIAEKNQSSIFRRLTEADVTNTIWNMGEQDKTVWNKYKDFAEQSFSFTIARTNVNNLKDFQSYPGIDLTWDNVYHQWSAEINPRYAAAGQAGAAAQALPQIRAQLRSLNEALLSISEVYSKEGKNPAAVDAFLFQTFNQLGFRLDPNKPPQGIPEEMLEAIRISNQKMEEQEKATESARKKYRKY